MGKWAIYDSDEDVIFLKLTPDSMNNPVTMAAVGQEVRDMLAVLDHKVYMLSDWSEAYLPNDVALIEELFNQVQLTFQAGILGIIRFGVHEPANKLALQTQSILSNVRSNLHTTREEALATLRFLRQQQVLSNY